MDINDFHLISWLQSNLIACGPKLAGWVSDIITISLLQMNLISVCKHLYYWVKVLLWQFFKIFFVLFLLHICDSVLLHIFQIVCFGPVVNDNLRSGWCFLIGCLHIVIQNVELCIELHCWNCGTKKWFKAYSLCFRMFWWWDFCYRQRGRAGMPNMLGIFQYCWKCALCFMVWPHPL